MKPNLKKGEWLLLIFNLLVIIGFTIYYGSIKNYEFMIYIGVIIFFFVLILATLKRSKFDYIILAGLSLWAFFHMAGGGVKVGSGVLYGVQLIPIINHGELVIFKFDQFVHAFGFGVSTLIAWHLIKPYLNEKTNYKIVYPLIALVGMGLGALNEIIEFTAVVLIPETGVGGYYNTALDLVFNMFGAITAIIFIHFREKQKPIKRLNKK